MPSWVHKVVERLVYAGELTADDVINAVSAQQEHRIPFVEVLVFQGKLTEKRLLAELASDRKLGTVTSAELSKLKIDPDVLDRVPVREAESLCVLPLKMDPKRMQLAVAVPSLDSALLDKLQGMVLGTMVPVLSTTFAIRAGIKCFYYRDKEAFRQLAGLAFDVTHGTDRCPNCGVPTSPGALQCAKCGLLGKDVARKEKPLDRHTSIARASLSQDPPTLPPGKLNMAEGEVATRQFSPASLLEENVVPQLIGGLEAALQTLRPFEAYVASFCDGRSTVVEIARGTKISSVEVCAVLRALEAQKVVSLEKAPILDIEPRTEPSAAVVPFHSRMTEPGIPAHVLKASVQKVPSQTIVEGQGQGVLQRAILLEREGRAEEAIAVLEGAMERDKSALLLNRLALIVLNQRKDAPKAMELLKRALELDPGNPAYEANLFAVMAMTGQGLENKPKKRGLLRRLFKN